MMTSVWFFASSHWIPHARLGGIGHSGLRQRQASELELWRGRTRGQRQGRKKFVHGSAGPGGVADVPGGRLRWARISNAPPAPQAASRKNTCTSTLNCTPPSTSPSISHITFPSLLEIRTPVAFSYLGKIKDADLVGQSGVPRQESRT